MLKAFQLGGAVALGVAGLLLMLHSHAQAGAR